MVALIVLGKFSRHLLLNFGAADDLLQYYVGIYCGWQSSRQILISNLQQILRADIPNRDILAGSIGNQPAIFNTRLSKLMQQFQSHLRVHLGEFQMRSRQKRQIFGYRKIILV